MADKLARTKKYEDAADRGWHDRNEGVLLSRNPFTKEFGYEHDAWIEGWKRPRQLARYLVFAGPSSGRKGGWGDFLIDVDDIHVAFELTALHYAINAGPCFSHVIDTETGIEAERPPTRAQAVPATAKEAP